MTFWRKWFSKKQTLPEEGNPALVEAMQKIALQDNSENRRRLYTSLLRSILIIPIPEVPAGMKPGLNTTDGNVQLQMVVLNDKQNRKATPVFSDVAALRNWDPNTPYVGFKAREFLKIVVTTEVQQILVNPFDPIRKMLRPGGCITRAEFEVLATGAIPSAFANHGVEFKLEAGQRVAIGVPAKKPRDEVLDSLKAAGNSIPEVEELHLFQLAAQANGTWTSHTVIGVRLKDKSPKGIEKEIVGRLGQTGRAKLKPGESLDFMVIRSNLEQIRKNGVLVFSRG